jgi:beta-glucanase (GH16 family)
LAGKVHAFLVGLGVFLMLVAGVLSLRLVSASAEPTNETKPIPASHTPTGTRTVGITTPTPSATPSTSTSTTIRLTPTPTPRPTTTSSPAAQPPTWSLVWSDEFGGSTVDGAKWSASASPSDDACWTGRPENLSVAGGVLTVHALREAFTCDLVDRSYTSGYIRARTSFTYGAFEIRAKAPGVADASGLWPGFWLGAADGSGAVDIATLYGGPGGYANSSQAVYTAGTQQNSSAVAGGPAGGFHTYRLEWESGVMRWYVDGAQVWTRDATTTADFATYFAKPYYVNLNFSVGGSGGDPSSATLPADFEVDYVHVYQR